MVNNPQVYNPNDFKVVDFTNKTDFGFTPEMGCMYDGRPIFGITGAPGVNAGESLKVPYHVGQQLALNLAKVAILKTAPNVDPAGIPTGVPLWDTTRLTALKNSYITELYTEVKPVAQSETDRLMAKIEEYKSMVDKLIDSKETQPEVQPSVTESVSAPAVPSAINPKYMNKPEVIAELAKRGIPHDVRAKLDDLRKLLA